MYYPRTLERRIEQVSSQFPALLLTGPRQSGKTTLLRRLADEDRHYVSLDDMVLRALAREDPRLFLDRFPPPVLVDEIQYAPELLPYIKIRIDEARRPGAFWLTGSQQFQMMRGITETLAGRVAVMNLLGFSLRERRRAGHDAGPFLPTSECLAARGIQKDGADLESVFQAIWTGSFPAPIAAGTVDHDVFMSSYLQTYLQRDVRDLTQVGNLESFTRFVKACAARTAQLLNLTDLARDVDVSVPTAKSWLSVLTANFQVFLLQPYHSNLTKRLVKTPKLYFLDTGLGAYLTGWSTPKTLAAGAMAGAMFETFVVTEILKSWWHQGRTPPFYFFRNKDKREIDLLFDVDGTLHPVEVKRSATVHREWASVFSSLEQLGKPIGEGAVICLTPDSIPLNDVTVAVSVGCL